MPHPDHVVAVDDTKGGTAKLPLLEPIYPLTAGLTNTSLRKSIAEALTRLPALPEWIDKAWREQNDWPSFADALRRHACARGRRRSRNRRAGTAAARL